MDFSKIIENIKVCVLKKYADFNGRASRAEYWSYALPVAIVGSILNLIGRSSSFFSVLGLIFSLALLMPSLAAVWRRLHDTGRKGIWFLIFLVPIVGWIVLLVWLCQPGQPGENEFGPEVLE